MRIPSGRHIKLHRSYTVNELARVIRRTSGTIRAWIETGLYPIPENVTRSGIPESAWL